MSQKTATTAAMPPKPLQFIVNHVILPPKLPDEGDNPQMSRDGEQHLVKLLSAQLEAYCRTIEQESLTSSTAWAINQAMLDRCAQLISTPSLDPEILVRVFKSLNETGELRQMLLHGFLLKAHRQTVGPSNPCQSPECCPYSTERREVRCL